MKQHLTMTSDLLELGCWYGTEALIRAPCCRNAYEIVWRLLFNKYQRQLSSITRPVTFRCIGSSATVKSAHTALLAQDHLYNLSLAH